jgi:ATP-dependent RNA helicase DBP3
VRRAGYTCCAIHGDKSQVERTAALSEFKSGKNPLLIATDVAARGLDIPDVEHVINYTFPLTIEDYVHRIGRTGRAGKMGNSVTLFTKNDKGLSGHLVNVLNKCDQPVPKELMAFGCGVKRKQHGMYGSFGGDGRPMKKAMKVKL